MWTIVHDDDILTMMQMWRKGLLHCTPASSSFYVAMMMIWWVGGWWQMLEYQGL